MSRRKLKLSEQVKQLEDDFVYQYKYNGTLVYEQKEMADSLKQLDKYYNDAVRGCTFWFKAFIATWIFWLLFGTGFAWIAYCPAKPPVVNQWLEEIKNVRFTN